MSLMRWGYGSLEKPGREYAADIWEAIYEARMRKSDHRNALKARQKADELHGAVHRPSGGLHWR